MVTTPWRRTFICASLLVPLVLLSTGCKTGSGWRAPWSGWGWSGASSPSATALNISKPSTQAPSPSATPGQPSRSLASSAGGVKSGSGVATVGATTPAGGVTAYPATPQAEAYPGRAGDTWKQDPGATKVTPAGGYQVGPYGMQAQPNPSGYANTPSRNAPAEGATSAPDSGDDARGGYGGREDYRTADQQLPDSRSPSGAPLGNNAPAENTAVDQPSSIYGEASGPATATESNVYGPVSETSPAEEGAAAFGNAYPSTAKPAEPSTPPTYGPPNTVAPESRPSTSPPPATSMSTTTSSTRAPLPQSLSTSGGYRPGSTSGAATSADGSSWR